MKYIALGCHKQYEHTTMTDTETGKVKLKRLTHIKEKFRKFIGERAGTRMVIEPCRKEELS